MFFNESASTTNDKRDAGFFIAEAGGTLRVVGHAERLVVLWAA